MVEPRWMNAGEADPGDYQAALQVPWRPRVLILEDDGNWRDDRGDVAAWVADDTRVYGPIPEDEDVRHGR